MSRFSLCAAMAAITLFVTYQPAAAMGDVSIPILTFPEEDTVTQDAVVLVPEPTEGE